ncbi:YdcF family protein [Bacillus luteolus]|uniref:YdcF family protein n=1 Tax=Litchfieldia luteola TaxID=682179 RepID=A0ABR9QML4_9BACI|nr:YdcF family protein [Cytobacillus luteolus]MBE4909646.1 YdcF family protein [Cytobacillus luteolus]MBP1941047.1 uncharacterized SAM-binding protein YcdF (DUF218 family) [Cytobacillus luteolus]
MKKMWGKILVLVLVIGLGYVISVHMLIASIGKEQPPDGVDYMIVLGARLHGEDMSLALYHRVQVALEYLKSNPNTNVVVSGGQGPGEDITEAEAMARFFKENGIEDERIIMEDRSTSTFENLKFSKEVLGSEVDEVVIVSNDFHLFRAKIIANRQGFEPYMLAAETPRIVREKLWLREYVAVLKTALLDW